MNSAPLPVIEVRSLGDVLRTTPPDRLASVLPPVQSAVAAALDWFVVQAPTLVTTFCNELLPDEERAPLETMPRVTAPRAHRSSQFRRHVSVLSRAEGFEIPAMNAFNALPVAERQARRNIDLPHDPLLITDYVYARAWLKAHGTNAGYWAYRYTRSALQFADNTNPELGAALTDLLHLSANLMLRAHVPLEPTAPH